MIDINTYFDKIFYINLAKDTARNEFMLSQFKEFGITNFERYESVVYKELPLYGETLLKKQMKNTLKLHLGVGNLC